MKRTSISIILVFFFSICYAQSQSGMNQSSGDDFKQADKELNQVYQKIQQEYKGQTDFLKSLKASQQLWIKFRDAEMLVKYPKSKQAGYGSVFPMCWSGYKAELTRQRTKTLQVWLDGIEEGDTCSGSVKTKQ
ncbi:lysozyme inhibitor LprI family protein [Pseudobacter ginsenosidimutans]|uniref:Uncharacterized protein YecT (DUF1311 family) n=1 Tax=Pseudobacter ginsenosidimutans TaxID=661488 RepID=A0A4Q7N433_9BACT|nr:lysozyme inhibitor LprI family protein [Pseudobacter ginsenosidimutans]QEC44284.1 DUF1311 domain-containing protein [Pseudobacter ginsenosidimutans]RZS75745.1 uncharacterized protein YecT (DUF1311 family) [Pseudobacter ginsenosidimutans]